MPLNMLTSAYPVPDILQEQAIGYDHFGSMSSVSSSNYSGEVYVDGGNGVANAYPRFIPNGTFVLRQATPASAPTPSVSLSLPLPTLQIPSD